MGILPDDDLAARASVNPWKLLSQLRHGDPGEVESLAAAFYRAAGHSGDAHDASQRASVYTKSGYSVQDTSPIDYTSETALADNHIKNQATRTDHLYRIAKILSAVGTDLQSATKQATSEVDALNSTIGKLDTEWETFWQGTGHHLPEEDWQPVRQSYIDKEVSAIRTHGGVVKRHVSSYESTLHGSLKSMADLGYIPPDALDEGPGDVDLGDGTKDGKATVDAAKQKNAAQFKDDTFKLQLINAAVDANGGHVSDAEFAYLKDYYQQTAPHSDQIWAMVGDGPLRNTAGRTYANAFMNMTRGAEQTDDFGRPPGYHTPGDTYGQGDGRGGLNGLPQSVLDILNSDLGTPVDQTPAGDSHDRTSLEAVYKNGHWEIANLGVDSGFSKLLGLASPDMQHPTEAFSKALGDAAIRWKQDLNTIDVNTYNDMKTPGHAPDGVDPSHLSLPDGFDGKFDKNHDPVNNDSFISDTLTLASHNSAGAADVLLDPADRRGMLGLNWHDGHGAAAVITSGTAPDPTGHTERNAATLAVMKDAAHDYRALDNMANGDVKTALTLMATRHIDTFAHDDTNPNGPAASGLGTLIGPDGQPYQGVILDNNDMANFLKMVSGAGPSNYGMLHAAALEEGAKYVEHATGANHAEMLKQASLLNGRVSSAGAAAAIDTAQTSNQHDKAHYAAQLIEEQKQATQDWIDKLGTDGLNSLLGVGAAVQPEILGPMALATSTMLTVDGDLSGPTDPNTPEAHAIQQLQDRLAAVSDDPRKMAQAALDTQSGEQWMAARAQGLEHPGQYNSMLDAHGRPLADYGESTNPHAARDLTNLMINTWGEDKGNADTGTGADQVLAAVNGQDQSWSGGKPHAGDRSLTDDNGSWGNATSAHAILYGGNSTYHWDRWSPPVDVSMPHPPTYYRITPDKNSPP
jgi:hypothetical protein